MKHALFISLFIVLAVPGLPWAQFPGITLPGGGNLDAVALPTSPGFPVSDQATEINTYIIAISESAGGMYGGFDPALELAGDLEQLVSSNNGLPLVVGDITAQYPALWPGYTNANYGQTYAPGSPEGNWLTTLGTQEGALEAAADQQASQPAELARIQMLEGENGLAVGVLQALEVSNEISIFGNELEMKQRNSTNAQLNALVVAESNRQNQEAQDQLQSLAVGTEDNDWQDDSVPPEPIMPNAFFTGVQ